MERSLRCPRFKLRSIRVRVLCVALAALLVLHILPSFEALHPHPRVTALAKKNRNRRAARPCASGTSRFAGEVIKERARLLEELARLFLGSRSAISATCGGMLGSSTELHRSVKAAAR